ncbi:MAG: 4Fe-4S dicluster domain-containing protein, partial [Clostridia bacterium]|nr:4Fe-4S dicluster domain-containing protein [Clostridia bacterium]
EPVKGGALANPPEEIKKLFKQVNPDASYASWAIRFAASLDGILAVLSGMSNIEQMEDNLSYMKNFTPLNEEELEAIKKAQVIKKSSKEIQCTACHYCTEGCPSQIPIPEIFAARNKQLSYGRIEEGKRLYLKAVEGKGSAADCISCRQCENVCPQHLEIIKNLEECREVFGD